MNFDIESGNFDSYPNMHSTYGYGSFLKIVIKKDREDHKCTCTPRDSMLQ